MCAHTESTRVGGSHDPVMLLIVHVVCSTNIWSVCGSTNHCIPVIFSYYEYYAAVVKWYSPQRGNQIVRDQSTLPWHIVHTVLLYTGSYLHTLPFLLAITHNYIIIYFVHRRLPIHSTHTSLPASWPWPPHQLKRVVMRAQMSHTQSG